MYNINEQVRCEDCGRISRVVYAKLDGPPACFCGNGEPDKGIQVPTARPLHSVLEPDENGRRRGPALAGLREIPMDNGEARTVAEIDAECARLTAETGEEHGYVSVSPAQRSTVADSIRHDEAMRQKKNGVTEADKAEHLARVTSAENAARATALANNTDPDKAAYDAARAIAPLAVQTGAYQRHEHLID